MTSNCAPIFFNAVLVRMQKGHHSFDTTKTLLLEILAPTSSATLCRPTSAEPLEAMPLLPAKAKDDEAWRAAKAKAPSTAQRSGTLRRLSRFLAIPQPVQTHEPQTNLTLTFP
mmetsp:Transcript_100452/g.181297  ORF Transcript_100452/g.181297 Transcript_100452/m.181297 type:complete len:113 (-) Transcript_100452:8-346(-)